jgi:hypothetical protein
VNSRIISVHNQKVFWLLKQLLLSHELSFLRCQRNSKLVARLSDDGSCLQHYEGDHVRLWVAHDDKSIELREIETGLSNGDLVEVRTNLKAPFLSCKLTPQLTIPHSDFTGKRTATSLP